MSCCYTRSGLRQRLAVVSLSIILVLLPCSGPAQHVLAQGQSLRASAQADQVAGDPQLSFARAVVTRQGVLVEWNSRFDPDNLGFNVYRLNGAGRTRLNGQVIGGDVFLGSRHIARRPEHSYSWLDAAGTPDSVYFIESVNLSGRLAMHAAVNVVGSQVLPQAENSDGVAIDARSQDAEASNNPSGQKEFPTALDQPDTTTGQIEDQWAVAAQSGLKIYINHDGWYRVTQQQMAAAGFTPATDVRNLSLFGDGRELAILTSKTGGQFGSGDYIEFYARGVDIPTADKRVYYLIVSAGKGKRITGDLHADAETPSPVSTSGDDSSQPADLGSVRHLWFGALLDFLNGVQDRSDYRVENQPTITTPSDPLLTPVVKTPIVDGPSVNPAVPDEPALAVPGNLSLPPVDLSPAATLPATKPSSQDPATAAPVASKTKKHRGKGTKRNRNKRNAKPRYSHAAMSAAAAATSFDYTVLLKERYRNDATGFIPNYYVSLLNGDTENYFGRVVSIFPVSETLTVSNPEMSALGPAELEIALQGVVGQNPANHQINVAFNGTQVTTLTFSPQGHPVNVVNIPVTQLVNGANTVTFTKTSSGDVCLVDYVRLTYPHALKADNNSLRLGLRQSQLAKVDGFATNNIRLIDYSDPFNVRVTRPAIEATPAGYAVTVSGSNVRTKSGRLLYAIPDTQFDQPAALSVNQPSTLNAVGNGADMVIIAHKSLVASAASLVALRQSQGMTVALVDVEDVYDEFSYGVHGPQAIRDFLSRANSAWATKPKYVIFLGDADLDPRNYEGVGDFDLVPTKLVDATFNETASDDWLTDFDNDGIADIPVGRLPVRTPAEATLAISKIVNFVPSNVPQSALLVADDPTNFYFNFEQANDVVQSLLPSGVNVEKVYRRIDANSPWMVACNSSTDPNKDCTPHGHIVAKFNEGQILVNYSGHGNVNTWTGADIFVSPDAFALNNTNKLPLVVVMDCLNGYFQDPRLDGIAESLIKAPNGGAVAAFASSGETIADGQHEMSNALYTELYGSPPIALGDAIKTAKAATTDIDVRRTWIFFGDPSMKIR